MAHLSYSVTFNLHSSIYAAKVYFSAVLLTVTLLYQLDVPCAGMESSVMMNLANKSMSWSSLLCSYDPVCGISNIYTENCFEDYYIAGKIELYLS